MSEPVATKVDFAEIGIGLHYLQRPGSGVCLYYKGWSRRFEDTRWWAVGELDLEDTDWSPEDMQEEGWLYIKPWSDLPEEVAADVQ